MKDIREPSTENKRTLSHSTIKNTGLDLFSFIYCHLEIQPAVHLRAVWRRQAWRSHWCRPRRPRWSSSCTCHLESADGRLQLFWLNPEHYHYLRWSLACAFNFQRLKMDCEKPHVTKGQVLYFSRFCYLLWWGNSISQHVFGLVKPDWACLFSVNETADNLNY